MSYPDEVLNLIYKIKKECNSRNVATALFCQKVLHEWDADRTNSKNKKSTSLSGLHVTLAPGAIVPTRGTDGSAGYYVIPNELVPLTRVSAQCHGTRYYVGSPCKHHPLNNIRSTPNKTCVVCELLKDYL